MILIIYVIQNDGILNDAYIFQFLYTHLMLMSILVYYFNEKNFTRFFLRKSQGSRLNQVELSRINQNFEAQLKSI